MATYKVEAIGKVVDKEGKEGRTFRIIDVKFEGQEWAEWSTSPETNAPEIGTELEGELNHTQYGWRFKKSRQGGGFGGGGGGLSPEAVAELNRYRVLEIARAELNDYITLYGGMDKIAADQIGLPADTPISLSAYSTVVQKLAHKHYKYVTQKDDAQIAAATLGGTVVEDNQVPFSSPTDAPGSTVAGEAAPAPKQQSLANDL